MPPYHRLLHSKNPTTTTMPSTSGRHAVGHLEEMGWGWDGCGGSAGGGRLRMETTSVGCAQLKQTPSSLIFMDHFLMKWASTSELRRQRFWTESERKEIIVPGVRPTCGRPYTAVRGRLSPMARDYGPRFATAPHFSRRCSPTVHCSGFAAEL